ncbi:tetratricopeptide repeat protein [bacterium]|nr:tetratricopeptide repeat protein [bacterium]
MTIRRLVTISILLLLPQTLMLSQQRIVDSLRQLPQAKDVEQRAAQLISLSIAYRAVNFARAEQHAREAVKLAEQLQSPRVSGQAHAALGWALEIVRNNEAATAQFEMARTFARRAGDGSTDASALRGLGKIAYYRGDIAAAMQMYRQAYRQFRGEGNPEGVVHAMVGIGTIHTYRGKYDSAEVMFNEARALSRDLDDHSAIARCLVKLGDVQRRQSSYPGAEKHFQEGLSLYRAEGDSAGIALTLSMLGSINLNQGNFVRARNFFERSKRIYVQIGDVCGKGILLTYIGHLHNIQGRYDSALECYRRSLAINESQGSTSLIVGSLLSIGNILYQQSHYSRALEAFQRGLSMSDKVNNKGLSASALIHIGRIQMDMGRYEAAKDKFHLATALFEELEDDGAVAVGLYHYADVLTKEGKQDEALEYYTRALRAFQESNDRQYVATTYHRIGMIQANRGEVTAALTSLNKSLRIREALQEQSGIAEVLTDLGEIQASMGRFDAAVALAERAYRIAEGIGAIAQMKDASKTLSTAFAAKKDFSNAYQYQLKYQAHKDSVLNVENMRSINEMTARYEDEKKEQKIALLEKDQLLQSSLLEKETITRNVFVVGVVVLLLLSGLLLHRYLYRKRTSEQLSSTLAQLKQTQAQLIHAEKMVTLGEMTAGLAHEIKNPLNFVTNFSEVAGEMLTELDNADGTARMAISRELRGNLEKIREHGRRADTIIQGMMLHARGTAGDWTHTDMNEVVESAVQLAYHGMRATHPSFDCEIIRDYHPSPLNARIVSQEISRVVLNLLNNAMYALQKTYPPLHEGNGHPGVEEESRCIWITTVRRGADVEIRIRDNGPGIPETISQKIFEPFFTTKPTGEGTGLGLSMSYDIIVNGHGGSIHCENTAEGAEFTITLPANTAA